MNLVSFAAPVIILAVLFYRGLDYIESLQTGGCNMTLVRSRWTQKDKTWPNSAAVV